MTKEEVIRYLKENREEFLKTVPEQRREYVNEQLDDPEAVEKHLEKVAKNAEEKRIDRKSFEFNLINPGRFFTLVGKDGTLEQLNFEGRNKEEIYRKLHEKMSMEQKLLVYKPTNGNHPIVYRYKRENSIQDFLDGKIEYTSVKVVEQKMENVKEQQQWLEEYHVPKEEQERLLQGQNLSIPAVIYYDQMQEQVIENQLEWLYSMQPNIQLSQFTIDDAKAKAKEEKVQEVELQTVGGFNEEDIQTLAMLAAVGENARKAGNNGRSREDSSVMFLENVHSKPNDKRFDLYMISILKGRMNLKNALEKATDLKQPDDKDLVQLIQEGLKFYQMDMSFNSLLREATYSQPVVLGRVAKFLERHTEFKDKIKLNDEEFQKIQTRQRFVNDWTQMRNNNVKRLDDETIGEMDRKKALKEYLAMNLLRKLDIENFQWRNGLYVEYIQNSNLEREQKDVKLEEAKKIEQPLMQRFRKDGSLDLLMNSLKDYIADTSVYKELCSKTKMTEMEAKGFSEKLLKEVCKKAKTDNRQNVAVDFIRQSVAPLNYKNMITDSELAEKAMRQHLNSAPVVEYDINAVWKIADQASLFWKKSGNYAQMHAQLKEIHANPIENSVELKEKMENLKRASAAYLAEKDGTEAFDPELPERGRNISGRNGQARYDAARSVYRYAESVLRQLELSKEKSLEEEPRKEEPQKEEPRKEESQKEEPQKEEPRKKTAPGSVETIFQGIKELDAVPADLTKQELVVAVLESMTAGQNKAGMELLNAMSEQPVRLDEAAKKLLQDSISKIRENGGKTNEFHLRVFNNVILNPENTQLHRLGGRLLNVLGEDGIKAYTGCARIPQMSLGLMQEGKIYDAARVGQQKNSIDPESVKKIVTAYMVFDAHTTGNLTTIRNHQRMNGVLGVLGAKGAETFMNDVYEKSGYAKQTFSSMEELREKMRDANERDRLKEIQAAYVKEEMEKMKQALKEKKNQLSKNVAEGKKEAVKKSQTKPKVMGK